MLSQEEIRIKAGLDYSKVTAGLTDMRAQVYKLAKEVPKQLSNILKANVFAGAASLISEVLPSWDDIWNRIYGVDDSASKRLDDMGKNLKSVRDALKKSQEDLSKTARDSQFNQADAKGKAAILESELEDAQKATKAAQDQVKFSKEHKLTIEEKAKAQTDLNHAIAEEIKSRDALIKQQAALSPSDLKSEFERKMDGTRGQVAADRNTIRAVNESIQSGEGTPELVAKRAAALGRINSIVKNRSLNGLGNVANALPNIEMFAGIKDAIITAQQEGMRAVIQRVKIVEVE